MCDGERERKWDGIAERERWDAPGIQSLPKSPSPSSASSTSRERFWPESFEGGPSEEPRGSWPAG